MKPLLAIFIAQTFAALSLLVLLSGCQHARSDSSVGYAQAHALAERLASQHQAASNVDRAVLANVTVEPLQYHQLSNQNGDPTLKTLCGLRYRVSDAGWGMVPDVTYPCDDQAAAQAAQQLALLRLHQQLGVATDGAQAKLHANEWSRDVMSKTGGLLVRAAVQDVSFSFESCIVSVAKHLVQTEAETAGARCEIFQHPGERLQPLRESIAKIPEVRQILDPSNEVEIANVWRASAGAELQLACVNRARYQHTQVLEDAMVERAWQTCEAKLEAALDQSVDHGVAADSAGRQLPGAAPSGRDVTSLPHNCDSLIVALCSAIGEDTETCRLVATQTKTFTEERCQKIWDRFDDVVGELRKMEVANQPLSPELRRSIAASDAPSFGPEQARVTVVEFADFQCPFSARAAKVVEELRNRYSTRVHFVLRQYPLPFHNNARLAAEAALAAHAQGKFWDFHDLLFKHQQELGRAGLERYAQAVGLNLESFKQAMDTKRYAAAVENDENLAKQAGVLGTPTMYVNGKRLANATDRETVETAIDAALAAAR